MILEKKGCLGQIKKIADLCKGDIGFITKQTLLNAIDERRIIVSTDNGNIVGFVHFYHRKKDKQTTIYEIAVLPQKQKRDFGKKMITELIEYSRHLNRETILLKCPVRNNSNGFYKKMGFKLIKTVCGKKRQLNVWTKKL